MRYLLEPEVAGGLGPSTILDTSVHPPVVHRLEYRFDEWFGDEIVESFPCFLVTSRLALLMDQAGLSGYRFADLFISKSEQYEEVGGRSRLPDFKWLQIIGSGTTTDFSLDSKHRLVVSERALHVLRQAELNHCNISETTE